MGKIIFWIVVFFAILLVLRLVNVAKQKSRRDAQRSTRKAIPPAEPTVRCVQCGTFLPKSESVAAATGYRCPDPGCTPRR